MDNTYKYELSPKDFVRIGRWQRRWLMLFFFILLALYLAVGVISAFSFVYKWPSGLYPLIGYAVLTPFVGIVAFKVKMNGGAYIYGKCSMSITEDGRIYAECERDASLPRFSELKKTMTPKGIVEHKGFYIVLGEKGDWLILPGDAPIEEIRKIIK